MANNQKKVVLLIVEGPCDEALLTDRLRELYKEQRIIFDVQRGDILFDFKPRTKTIKNIIGEKVKETLIKRKFRAEDLLAVLHIIDTDGCLIPEDKVVIDETLERSIYYQEEQITVPNLSQKNNIINRNTQRKRNISIMKSIDSVHGKKIAYQMYYLSRNLEHVIFNEPNPEKETKFDQIERYIDSLEVPLEECLNQFMPDFEGSNYEEIYKESWEYISNSTASLKRSTNLPLLFNYVTKKSEQEV